MQAEKQCAKLVMGQVHIRRKRSVFLGCLHG